MMRIAAEEFFRLARLTPNAFNVAMNREEVALAFGTTRALAGGEFLDLDVVAWEFLESMQPTFTRWYAAGLLRFFSDKWHEAVAAADRKNEPVFLIIAEFGERVPDRKSRDRRRGFDLQGRREALNFEWGVLSELANFEPTSSDRIPDTMLLINVTRIVRRVRENAARIGLDFSKPLCPPLDDPAFEQARAETRTWRERNVDRMERHP